MTKKITLVALVIVVLMNINGYSQQTISQEPKVLFSFVTVGCNRLEKEDATSDNPSTANIVQLKRTFQDISELSPLPKYFFFTGDMVIGYTEGDTALLRTQLQAWVDLYLQSGLPEKGVEMIPTLGNHESLYKKGRPCDINAEKVWLSVMKPLIKNFNGPKEGTDGLTSDQSGLSYSFNYKNTHFLVLNTDGSGRESSVPVNWITKDLSANHQNKEIEHAFAFGHKPAYPAPGEDGIDSNREARDSFWNAMEDYGCQAFFSAHNHLYYQGQLHAGKTWQIVAGNGGSKLSKTVKADSDKFYGYTLVEVLINGDVHIKSMGRNLSPDGYNKPSTSATTERAHVIITKELN